MVAVGEPIGWVEGEDDGGSFGDLLMAPEPDPSRSRHPCPEPDARVGDAGTGHARSPSRRARAASCRAVPPRSRERGLARELGVDLATVTAVRARTAWYASRTSRRWRRPAAARPRRRRLPRRLPRPQRRARGLPAKQTDRRAAIRAVVARKMTPSAAIPQFTVWRELHLDAANATRDGLSWTTVLLRTYAAALREVPELLSRWEDDRASEAGPPSIALAVATDRGLMVPTFSEPDLGDAADARRGDPRGGGRGPARAGWTVPTWASPTARCPTSAGSAWTASRRC